MILAVLFILLEIALLAWPSSIYLWHEYRHLSLAPSRRLGMTLCFGVALLLALLVFWLPMRRGIRALEELEA
jgi:hypothetical protein